MSPPLHSIKQHAHWLLTMPTLADYPDILVIQLSCQETEETLTVDDFPSFLYISSLEPSPTVHSRTKRLSVSITISFFSRLFGIPVGNWATQGFVFGHVGSLQILSSRLRTFPQLFSWTTVILTFYNWASVLWNNNMFLHPRGPLIWMWE